MHEGKGGELQGIAKLTKLKRSFFIVGLKNKSKLVGMQAVTVVMRLQKIKRMRQHHSRPMKVYTTEYKSVQISCTICTSEGILSGGY